MYTRASQFVRICITYPEPRFDTNFNAGRSQPVCTPCTIRTFKPSPSIPALLFVCVELKLTW
jgi:hypothetical protein